MPEEKHRYPLYCPEVIPLFQPGLLTMSLTESIRKLAKTTQVAPPGLDFYINQEGDAINNATGAICRTSPTTPEMMDGLRRLVEGHLSAISNLEKALKPLKIGDKVTESPVGSGTITSFTDRGYPRVNYVAVSILVRDDGFKFDPHGQYDAWKVQQAAMEGTLPVVSGGVSNET